MVSTCPARAALAGNPSDGYGGAVVALPVPDLQAMASATEADVFSIRANDPDLAALLTATADAFAEVHGELPAVTLSASTSIPRSVGLAGSSALVIAALRSLAAWVRRRWDVMELAELALSVERDRLDIEAGLQDRLVQSAGDLVTMRFDPPEHRVLHCPVDLALFVAWSVDAGEPSTTVHRSLRRRFDAGDPGVVDAMRDLTAQADRASDAIESGDRGLLGNTMNRSFDIRASIAPIDELQRRLIDTGRRDGASMNSAGSGGSVVGLARDPDHLETMRTAYDREGFEFAEVV